MIRGIFPILYSYYADSGALDMSAHDEQLDWAVQQGASGVTLFGLASEGGALTQDERRAILTRTCERLPATAKVLVTVRPDDDIFAIARLVLGLRSEVGLIVQIGRDPGPSLRQFEAVMADPALAAGVRMGLQLAPGLIDTEFSAASLQQHPTIVQRLAFVKAEYNSIELDAHLKALGQPLDLLVGRNGQNLLDYMRIGAVGAIPGPEMTAALAPVVQAWADGRHAAAMQRYGVLAPYIDFAMQDLDTVIDMGRIVTARKLGIELGVRRNPSRRDERAMQAAGESWYAYWHTNIDGRS